MADRVRKVEFTACDSSVSVKTERETCLFQKKKKLHIYVNRRVIIHLECVVFVMNIDEVVLCMLVFICLTFQK